MSNYVTIESEDTQIKRIVKKSNKLVRSYYDLSLTELRIIALATTYIEDETNKVVMIPIASYKHYLGLTKVDYRHINEVLIVLRKNTLVVVNNDDVDKFTNEVRKAKITGWVNDIIIDNGYIKIDFTDHVWGYIIDLKNNYTSYQLKTYLKFKSKYSARLYEILKSYAFRKCEQIIKLDDLREMLMIDQKYAIFADLKKYILDPSLKEINNVLQEDDIESIEYLMIKNGRKFESIKFYLPNMNKVDSKAITVEPSEEIKMVMSMTNNELFMGIKTILMLRYKVKFNELDVDWNDSNKYSKFALAVTYTALTADQWANHPITDAKAFFAEHLRRESEKGA
jgi:plasmid replication initiation protein